MRVKLTSFLAIVTVIFLGGVIIGRFVESVYNPPVVMVAPEAKTTLTSQQAPIATQNPRLDALAAVVNSERKRVAETRKQLDEQKQTLTQCEIAKASSSALIGEPLVEGHEFSHQLSTDKLNGDLAAMGRALSAAALKTGVNQEAIEEKTQVVPVVRGGRRTWVINHMQEIVDAVHLTGEIPVHRTFPRVIHQIDVTAHASGRRDKKMLECKRLAETWGWQYKVWTLKELALLQPVNSPMLVDWGVRAMEDYLKYEVVRYGGVYISRKAEDCFAGRDNDIGVGSDVIGCFTDSPTTHKILKIAPGRFAKVSTVLPLSKVLGDQFLTEMIVDQNISFHLFPYYYFYPIGKTTTLATRTGDVPPFAHAFSIQHYNSAVKTTLDQLRSRSVCPKTKLSELKMEQMRQTLFAWDDIAKAANIPYVLAKSTLLGALRHGDFVPWGNETSVYIKVGSLKQTAGLKLPKNLVVMPGSPSGRAVRPVLFADKRWLPVVRKQRVDIVRCRSIHKDMLCESLRPCFKFVTRAKYPEYLARKLLKFSDKMHLIDKIDHMILTDDYGAFTYQKEENMGCDLAGKKLTLRCAFVCVSPSKQVAVSKSGPKWVEWCSAGKLMPVFVMQVKQALIEWTNLARKYDITYSLYYGSLLGMERHRDMIPHDTDIDVVVDLEGIRKLKEIPGTVDPRDHGDIYEHVDLASVGSIASVLTVMVHRSPFLWDLKADRLNCLGNTTQGHTDACAWHGLLGRVIYGFRYTDIFGNCRLPMVYCNETDMRPLGFNPVPCTFGGVDTFCPPKELRRPLLYKMYGAGWEITRPKYGWHFNGP